MSLMDDAVGVEALPTLSWFRSEFHDCLPRRADTLFELCDAMLCSDGPVSSLVDLTLVAEHRRGHGAMYDALNHGQVDTGRLRRSLAELPLPRAADGRIVLAVDVSPWLRPDAPCSPDRLFCHVYGRSKNTSQFIPGWPYSFVAALETGRTSWTALLDAVRLGPADDATAVTAAQLREVVTRLIAAGHWRQGEADILIVMDSGYDVCRLAFVLADLPVELVGRIRSDRVMLRPAPPRPPGTIGRPRKHGGVFTLAEPDSWHAPDQATVTETTRYGTAHARAWDRLHPRLTHRGPWLDHDGNLPVVEGTLVRLEVEHLPGDRDPKPVWLWSSVTGASGELVDVLWQAFLRRFDLEHTFRLFKQTLGWTCPRVRSCEAADRWTWLVIAAHTQLRLARPLAEDLRRPWERPAEPGRLTPARVRRGFRHLRVKAARPARAPKPSWPGPGRPPGSKNRRPASRYDVGKTVKRDLTLAQHRNRAG
ncbi:NF041680 family putative transposase [Nocardiopsis sp. HUAS JQ3]|uniref:NF041680 family putative transposase n=1 Tax=Nocardiopsis sp. HUAS JQ3 TaxID=3061629 RepID=UPI0023A9E600|nr:NF041680 family putative transposase [Nocardiopsis sp. HUAS JQ3]WDZ88330.1 transposase [Nocardiopsis sp. HUAS JQ3]WDZ88898.1 transposase [Nocardiopsis sp. HUAS JQ3]WDZ93591.1 transposase [Nocardiopsis sp. HUAS JQ3]WDZ93592.1 transposase [Nocardiopsis sp. HUAS JQ3]